MTKTEKLQKVAKWTAIIFGLLGLLSATGFGQLPTSLLRPGALAIALAVVGLFAGRLAVLRSREIEKERWRVLGEPGLTSGERDYAHRNAEQQRRGSATAFLLAPTLLAVWLSYQIRIEGSFSTADILPVVPMLSFLCGLWVFRSPTQDGPPEL